MIDLFATKLNNCLPQYMSPLPDLKALAVNALAVSWDGMNAYAFPPTPLIQAVLNKVMTDKVRLCLIAPCWPSQAWFPTLLELLTDHPRRLPKWDHLLWHPLGRVYYKYSSPSFYKLHAWKLSGASSEQNNFLRMLSAASPLLTIDSYQSKWSVYQTWCGKATVHPVFPTLSKLVDFLNYLFTEMTLSVSAIKGYSYSYFLKRLFGCWENVWDDTCMTALRSMSVARPRVKVQDLSLVLSSYGGAL
jgi:hypothetical protein